jgi:hypothetical protein
MYQKILWIMFGAFAVRLAVGCYFREFDFWVKVIRFLRTAQKITNGKGIAFGEGPLTAIRIPITAFYPCYVVHDTALEETLAGLYKSRKRCDRIPMPAISLSSKAPVAI